MGKAVGIDLGTTNSVGAFCLTDKPEVVIHDTNTPPERELTRSAVAYIDGSLVVGYQASLQGGIKPDNVITSIKRLMGRGYQDPDVQRQVKERRFSYTISPSSQGTENKLVVIITKEDLQQSEYEPEDISAEILKQVARNAQDWHRQQVGEAVIDQAVITIPAYFDDRQKYATRIAAIRAGLTPLELLSEPTAAAISYGYRPNDDGDGEVILVYDYGGGTFDASLINSAGNYVVEQGVAGDLWLGGDDIDNAIIEYVKQSVEQEEGLNDIDGLIAKMPSYQRVRFVSELRGAAETAKIELSKMPTATIRTKNPLLDEMGMIVPVEATMTRQHFEALIAPMVERTIAICRQAVAAAHYELGDVDRILLVGGSSQIPYVQEQVKKAFGAERVLVHPRPMTAVAEGAAIVAAGRVDKTVSVNRDYVLKLVDGYDVILSKGEADFTARRDYKTVSDGQQLINLRFFNADDTKLNLDNQDPQTILGQVWLGLDKEYPSGTEIQVTLMAGEKGEELKVVANLKNDPSVKVNSTLSRDGSDAVVYQKLYDFIDRVNSDMSLTKIGLSRVNNALVPIIQLANRIMDDGGRVREDMLMRANEELEKLEWEFSDDLNNAITWIEECDLYLKFSKSHIPDDQRARIESLRDRLKSALERKAIGEIQKLCEDVKQELDTVPSLAMIPVAAVHAIRRANRKDPRQAREIEMKLNRMVNAADSGNVTEANRALEELRPDVIYWMGQDDLGVTVQTGIRK